MVDEKRVLRVELSVKRSIGQPSGDFLAVLVFLTGYLNTFWSVFWSVSGVWSVFWSLPEMRIWSISLI